MNSYLIEELESRLLLSNVRIGVIGDYGNSSQNEADVANLVKSWNPDYIVTVGDNNYPDGAASTIDPNVGQFYHDYIYNYQGAYGAGSPTPRFLPTLGNHDWYTAAATPYLNYFDLPGNERYYDFVVGSIHFFMIDSDSNEPHGTSSGSIQGQWLQAGLASATEPFKLVLFHHPPYSSGQHGSNAYMQWPFAQWGASAVLAGHDHLYERLSVNGIPHFIDGLGGVSIYQFNQPVAGSQFRYNTDYGAMRLDGDDNALVFSFYSRAGTLIDQHTLLRTGALPSVTVTASDAVASEDGQDPGLFTFTRTGNLSQALSVNLTLSGSAQNGQDFPLVSNVIMFPIGSAATTLRIIPFDDSSSEGTESFTLTINPSGLYNKGAPDSATITILDNDAFNVNFLLGGSTWRYLDNGSNQQTAWKEIVYAPANSWPTGGARFGYGDPGMVTIINSGPANNRIITHYFRTTFNVTNPVAVTQLSLQLLRDDGAIIYINGTEVWRSNMAAGSVSYLTFASTTVGGADETTFFPQNISPSVLVAGSNVIAVELHQATITTSDAVFDLILRGLVDTTPPVAPSVPDLTEPSDSGFDDDDNVTNVNTPAFLGTAEPGSTVRIYANGNLIGSVIAANGIYNITSSQLADGDYSITAVATDAAGNVGPSSAALPITIDTTSPHVSSAMFLDETAPMILRFTFDEEVGASLITSDLLLQNLTTSSTVAGALMSLEYNSSTNEASFTFPGYASGLLPEGRYHTQLPSANVTDRAGNPLVTDGVLDFVHLIGDANHDGNVSLTDFNIVAGNFGLSPRGFSQGDFNYDGMVNLADFNLLASRFGITIGPTPFGATRIAAFRGGVMDSLREDLLAYLAAG